MSEVKIRVAEIGDAEKILEIYSPYVDRTAVSFEYDLPSIEKFRQRMKHIQKRFPFLVATIDDEIVGFAYTHLFSDREAYKFCLEVSIYLHQDFQRQGIGKLLYEKIEKISRDQNFVSLYARVATTEIEDEFLTNASLKFHEKLGFQIVGKLPKCGFKFDRWYDMTIMMKDLRDRFEDPPPVVKFVKI